ncbi:hypothetical protein Patl1_29440 [Pistacia atlantica]|uniref:Uncharacterized protein n=1 Tax=Pistacia atlantica TaxID=434234 RepID=A0ACC1ABJ8_9ROSI|nr:hypothetical protein Patl1_29440 [Pistacia atlantica]
MVGIFLTFILVLIVLPRFPCLSPDESSYGLSYNGGKIMTEPVTVSLLWFGTRWEESGRETIRNAIASLVPSRYNAGDSEVPTLGDWWDIVRQYRDDSNAQVTDRVSVGAECFYSGSELNMTLDRVVEIGKSVFNKTAVEGSAGRLNCTRVFDVNENRIYHILFSYSVMFFEGQQQREFTDWCSGKFQLPGMMVSMTWAREPQIAADQCSISFRRSSYLGPPNGDEKIDSLVGHMVAKIAEEVTNQDGRGWISNDGTELTISSSCISPFREAKTPPPPLYVDEKRRLSFNAVGLNGYRYIVPYIWDQNIRNCALKPSETCSRNAVVLEQASGRLKGGIVVNHTDGLQPYPRNQKCQWEINFPDAKFISFTVNFLAISADSDDRLRICQPNSNPGQCSTIQSNNGDFDKNFKVFGSKASIEFSSGDHVAFEFKRMGAELYFR